MRRVSVLLDLLLPTVPQRYQRPTMSAKESFIRGLSGGWAGTKGIPTSGNRLLRKEPGLIGGLEPLRTSTRELLLVSWVA